MIEDLRTAARGQHASNLGAVIAREIASAAGIPAFIVDPVAVDEMSDIARISGWAGLERESLLHALNHKAVAKRHARSVGKRYGELRLVVAHLGSGISIAAHEYGRMTDVSNPRDEGPFSPDRAGGLPALALARVCFSGKYDYKTIEKSLFGEGGIYSYLGTRDLRKVREMIGAGNARARLVFDAMAYQTAKYIGAMAAALEGRVDAILLTGGMANDGELCAAVSRRVSFIAPVSVYPGEDELSALAEGALRALSGEEAVLEYR
jgi:butyrate kinase